MLYYERGDEKQRDDDGPLLTEDVRREVHPKFVAVSAKMQDMEDVGGVTNARPLKTLAIPMEEHHGLN